MKFSRLKTTGGSYLASHDPREILGAGPNGKIDSVEIRWPSGKSDKLTNLPINSYVTVVEGEGLKIATKAESKKVASRSVEFRNRNHG